MSMKPELDPYVEKKKVFIATPAYDGRVWNTYAQSMIVAAQECYRQHIEVCSSIPSNGAFIEVMRNILVKRFLETDCTHLMWVDADLGFPQAAIAGLVHAGLRVCAGVYPQREPETRFVVKLPNDTANVVDGWLEVERCPGGFMCIEREVLEDMSCRAPVVDLKREGHVPMIYRTEMRDGEFIGEDTNFCDDYRAMREEVVFDRAIWVWPNLDFNHAGYTGNLHDFLSREVKAKSA